MRNAKFWINKTSNQNIEEFTIFVGAKIYCLKDKIFEERKKVIEIFCRTINQPEISS